MSTSLSKMMSWKMIRSSLSEIYFRGTKKKSAQIVNLESCKGCWRQNSAPSSMYASKRRLGRRRLGSWENQSTRFRNRTLSIKAVKLLKRDKTLSACTSNKARTTRARYTRLTLRSSYRRSGEIRTSARRLSKIAIRSTSQTLWAPCCR